jgi:hypothetical protein
MDTKPQYDLRKFSQNDQLFMDLVDKKDVKALQNLAENGIKPSENLNQLIFLNTRISDRDKQTMAAIFKTNQSQSEHKQATPGIEPVFQQPRSQSPESMEIDNIHGTKHHRKNETMPMHGKIVAGLKGLFHDM